MGTSGLILHEQGAIWKRLDGYPTGLGKEILEFCKGGFRNFNIKDLYKHFYDDYIKFTEKSEDLSEYYTNPNWVSGTVEFSELDMSVEEYINETAKSQQGLLAERGMLDVSYVYLIYVDALFVKGTLTHEEDKIIEGNLLNRIYSEFRQIFIKDGIMYFVDFNGKIKEVTI